MAPHSSQERLDVEEAPKTIDTGNEEENIRFVVIETFICLFPSPATTKFEACGDPFAS